LKGLAGLHLKVQKCELLAIKTEMTSLFAVLLWKKRFVI